MKKTPTFLKNLTHPKFYIRCFFVMLMIFSTQITLAQEIYYVPVQLSGFNHDVIAEDTPANQNTTISLDSPNDGGNFVFMTNDYPGVTDGGLPSSGEFISQAQPEVPFSFAAYKGDNSLRLVSNAQPLTFENNLKAKKLYILTTSGEGNSNFSYVISFSDNSTQVSSDSFVVGDWDTGPDTNIAYGTYGRVKRPTGVLSGLSTFFKLYQIEIPIETQHQNKKISSIKFQNYSNGILNVFAITAELFCTELITITANKEFLCDENDSVELTAVGGDPGTIFFQGDDPEGEHINLGGSSVTVTGPGTYYFRAYNEEDGCWGASASITIEVLDFDLDAGEDQYLACGESVQIGFEPDDAINETTTFEWSPINGLNNSTIPNPIASPTETTTYTLIVTHEGCEFTDTVTVTVDHCLPPLVICVGDEINLNEGLPEGVNPNDVIWYEDDNNSPGTEINSFDDLTAGTYWASFDGKDWKMEVSISFTEECLECYEVMHEKSGQDNQTWSSSPAEYGVLDFYKVPNAFRVQLNVVFIISTTFFDFTNNINVQFTDGSQWGSGGIDPIADLTGSEDKPIIRIVFGSSGIEGFYGSRVSAADPDYQLEPLELINGASFADIVWNLAQENTLNVAPTLGSMSFYFRSLNIIPCPPNEVFINPQIRQRVQH